jgi:hypothetical protein
MRGLLARSAATLPRTIVDDALKITTTVRIDVDADGDDELETRILDIAQEELLKYSAALADRLEAEGIEDVALEVSGGE